MHRVARRGLGSVQEPFDKLLPLNFGGATRRAQRVCAILPSEACVTGMASLEQSPRRTFLGTLGLRSSALRVALGYERADSDCFSSKVQRAERDENGARHTRLRTWHSAAVNAPLN